MGTQKHRLTLELSKLFLDKCVNLQADQRCDIKDTLYDIVSIEKNLDSIIIDIQDENVIILSGEVTKQNFVRLSFRDEALDQTENKTQANCTNEGSFTNSDCMDDVDELSWMDTESSSNLDKSKSENVPDRQGRSSRNSTEKEIDLDLDNGRLPKLEEVFMSEVDKAITHTDLSYESSTLVNDDKNALTLNQVNSYLCNLNIATNPHIRSIRAKSETDRGIRMRVGLRSGRDISKYFSLPYQIVDFVDGEDFFPWLRSKSDVFTNLEDEDKLQREDKLSEVPSARSIFVYGDKNAVTLEQVNTYLHTLEFPSYPDIHNILANAESGRGIRMRVRLKSKKVINKQFQLPFEVVDFVDGDDFFPWLRSKSLHEKKLKCADILNAGSSETNNDDSIVEEKSPTQKRTYQYYKQINDDKNTTIEINEAGKFMYEDKDAVTLHQVNTYLSTLNIPTNPPNLIRSFTARAEKDRGIRMKFKLKGERYLGKHFRMPYEIVDFVDGDDFLPWVRSKLKNEGKRSKGSSETNYDDSIVEEDSPTQKHAKITTTGIENHEAGKFMYEDKDAVTLKHVNTYLCTLNFLTNPPNIIRSCSARAEKDRGIRMRFCLKGGRNFGKKFRLPYEIVDFVNGDDFLPWFRSKLENEGKWSKDIKKEFETDSNEDDDNKDANQTNHKKGNNNRKRKTCTDKQMKIPLKKAKLKHVCGRMRTKKPANPHAVPPDQFKTVVSQIDSVSELSNDSREEEGFIKESLGVPLLTPLKTMKPIKSIMRVTSSLPVPPTTVTFSKKTVTFASTPNIITPSMWHSSSMATSSVGETSNVTHFQGAGSSSAMATSSLGTQSDSSGSSAVPVFLLENYASSDSDQ